MARWRRRRWGSVAGWAAVIAAGLGTGAAVLSMLEPGRREQARRALDRMGEMARQAGGQLGALRGELPQAGRAAEQRLERRPGLLGGFLLVRALLGGGLLRIPFGLLGFSTLASTERGRAAADAVTRAVRRTTAALRSYAPRAPAEQPVGPDGGAVILGPDAHPAT